jgi:hypothetical protein
MEFLEGLRGWFSRSGAPWRPYLDVPESARVLAVAGGPSVVVLQSRLWTGRRRARPVAANDPTPGCTPPDPGKSPHAMITSSRVKGATVLCGDGGACRIHDLSIDKKSGRIDYALVAFDDFLGLSEKIYPVRWALLAYDAAANAYRIPFNASALKATPSLTPEDLEWFGAGDAVRRAKMAQYYAPYLTSFI